MKITNLAVISFALVIACFVGGCTYSSSSMLRAQGADIHVFGAWGYIRCKDSSVTLYRSTDAISHIKGEEYPKVPVRPNISETADSSTLNIGKVVKPVITVTPKPAE